MKENRPPQWAERLLLFFCRIDLQEPILGDLEEQFFSDLESKGSSYAKRRFVWNVIRFFRPGIIKPFFKTQTTMQRSILTHNIKIATRMVLRDRTFSLIHAFGLAVGILVCLLTLLFYNYETNFDQHHTKAEQTFRVVQHTQRADAELHWNTTAYPLAAALRSDFSDFEYVTQTAGPMNRLFSVEKEGQGLTRFEEPHVLFVDQYYTQVFDFEWIAGDPNTALAAPDALVVSREIAEKCLSPLQPIEELVGTTLLLNNKDPLVITGIIENPPSNSSLQSQMLISYEFFKKHNPFPTGNWSGNYRGTTFVVTGKKDLSAIEERINAWKGKYLSKEDDQTISYRLQALSAMHHDTLYGSSPQSYQIPLWILNSALAIAFFILLVAIVNFINLVTARSLTRGKEVSIKKIIGGNSNSVLQQFFLENTIVVVAAILIALVSCFFTLPVLNDYLSSINLQLQLRWLSASQIIAISLLVVFLASSYPAYLLSMRSPLSLLQNKRMPLEGKLSFRKALTVFQFTLVQAFVIAAIIIGNQIHYLSNQDLGFDQDNKVLVKVPSFDQLAVFQNEVLKLPGVKNVSISSGPPMTVEDFGLGTTFWWPHQTEVEGMAAEMKVIDTSYLAHYDIKLIAGRNFRENKGLFDEFIVNERLARSLNVPTEEILGKKLRINEGEAVIVGVVKDFHNHSLQKELTPLVLMNWNAFLWDASIEIESFDAMVQVEETWKGLFPDDIFRYRLLDETMDKEYFIERVIFTGFRVFSLIVILLGCLGLFGLVSFMVAYKTKEVGVRKVLGASLANVLYLLSSDYLKIIAIAFVLAVPVVWFSMDRWLSSFSYRIAMQPWMFAAGGVMTLLIAFGITISKSLHTAKTNPVTILRDE